MALDIVTIPCRTDNYAYLLRDPSSGAVAVVDAPDASAIEAALDARGWTLDTILITHHHEDHVAGVGRLRERFGARVVGAAADANRLPALDEAVAEGDTVMVGTRAGRVIEVPGHTIGHIAYYFGSDAALFSADSLMVMGCGRLFEGSPEQMWTSLTALASLPDDTQIHSGHEYAESNLRFALSIDGENPELRQRADAIAALRAAGHPTVPAPLSLERATNPFLRASDPDLKARLGMAGASDAQVFAEICRRKDRF